MWTALLDGHTMKYSTTVELLRYSWDQVASALWQKYPNPYSKHVLTEDVISRVLRGTNLVTRRLLTKTNRLPRWGNYVFGNHARQVCIVEESVVDPVKKTFTIYTRNIGFTKLMVVTEKQIFQPAKDNKDWTELVKQSWVDSSLKGVATAIQHFGMERYKSNQTKATKGLKYILDNMFVPEKPPMEGFPADVARLRDNAKAKAKGMAAKARPAMQ